MRSKLSFNWGLVATGAIVVAILATGAVAIAGSKSVIPKGAIYACVTNDFGTLNLSSARAKCPAGQRKIAWNVRGKRGSRGVRGMAGRPGAAGPVGQAGARGLAGESGPAGADGADGLAGADGEPGAPGKDGVNGLDGADGAPGLDGADGEPGLDGANGADGAPGSPGEDGPGGPPGPPGADGAPGAKGDKGDQGLQGIQGPPGATGPAGPGYAMTASSPIQVASLLEGVPGVVSVLPLSGMADSPEILPWSEVITLPPASEAIKRVQFLPSEGTISSISLRYTTAVNLPMPDPADLRVSLYISPGSGTTFHPAPGATCYLTLPSGTTPAGTTMSAVCSGLSISIPLGTAGLIIAQLSSGGLPVALDSGQIATSIEFS